MEKISKAYAFFDCNASKQEIEQELPSIRDCVKSPRELELSLMKCSSPEDSIVRDSKLWTLAREAKNEGIKYVLEASLSNSNNKKTADELASILNQMYQSHLYQDREEFQWQIVYKEKSRYIFRE